MNNYLSSITLDTIEKLHVFRWILLWLIQIPIVMFFSNNQMVIIGPLAVISALCFFLNLFFDRSGVNVFLFLIASSFLSGFVFRYQLGLSLPVSTNYIDGFFNISVYILLTWESFLYLLSSKEKSPFIVKMGILFIILCAFQVLRLVVNIDLGRRFFQNLTFNYALLIISYFIAMRNDSKIIFSKVLYLILWCLFFDSVYGFYQSLFGIPEFELTAVSIKGAESVIKFSDDFLKIFNLKGSTYGLFYTLPFLLLLFLTFRGKFFTNFNFLILINAIFSFLLLLTFSERMAIIMFFTGIVLYYLLNLNTIKIYRIIMLIFLFFLILFLTKYYLPTMGSVQSTKYYRLSEVANIQSADNMIWRFAKWNESIDILQSKSLFIGDGFLNEYGFHNEFLNIIITLGLSGFIVWFLLLFNILRMLWNISKNFEFSPPIRNFSYSLFIFCLSLLPAAIPNNPFTYSCGLVFFVFSGVLLAYQNQYCSINED
jgi:hypothetical protein